MCHAQRFHLLNEEGLFIIGIEQGCQFNIDVFLAFGCVVQVQHTFALAGLA